MHKKQHLVCRDSCVHSKSQEGSSRTIHRISPKRVKTLQWTHDMNTPHRSDTNGIAERAVPHGGTVRRHVLATCATCATRWPMARQRRRKMLGATFDGPCYHRSEPKSAVSPNTRQGCITLAKRCVPESSLDMYYVREEGGQAICSLRNAKTSRTCQLRYPRQTFQAPGSRTRKKAVVSMRRRISQTLRSSSTSTRRNARLVKPKAR